MSQRVEAERGVVYGGEPDAPLLLDVYWSPVRANLRPAMILIHGGGMWTGSRSHMAESALALAHAGYVAFAIDYRLVDAARGRNRWPAQLDDAQRAVRWIRANAARFDVDPQRIGAYGWSAGGQLAALLGTRETRDNALATFSSRVSCVVDLAGDIDLAAYTEPPERDETAALLGGTPEEVPERYRDASPLTWIDGDTVPFLVIHGAQDDVVPITQSQRLVAALQASGATVTYLEIPTAGHNDMNWSLIGTATLAFLDTCLIPHE